METRMRRRRFTTDDAKRWVREMRKAGVLSFSIGDFSAHIESGDQLAPRIGFGAVERDEDSWSSKRRK